MPINSRKIEVDGTSSGELIFASNQYRRLARAVFVEPYMHYLDTLHAASLKILRYLDENGLKIADNLDALAR